MDTKLVRNLLDGFGSLFYQVENLVEFCGEEIKSGQDTTIRS